jgi:hypothetical protein
VRRVAKRELNVDVVGEPELLGYIEYPSHYENNLDGPVGIVFLTGYDGEVRPNIESAGLKWFKELPKNSHPDQNDFINSRVLTLG